MILVDDEDEVRGRISSRISAETGFVVVASAGNGYDALELIEEHSPHVVLTDIRMPYIDGLELAAIVRRDYPTVKVGFITGYNEFDYAREAIALGVHSYLTKPLTEEAIRSSLGQLKTELDREYAESYSREMVERQYAESLPLLVEHAFSSLLVAPTSDRPHGTAQLRDHGVDLESGRYLVAFVAVERTVELWDVIEFEKVKMAVRTTLQKRLASQGLRLHTFFFHDGIVCVMHEGDSRFVDELDITLNQIIRSIERFQSVTVSIGVSRLHIGDGELRRAYDEALAAAEVGRMQGVGRLLWADQVPSSPPDIALLDERERVELDQALRSGQPDRVREVIQAVTVRLRGIGRPVDLRLVMMDVAAILIRYAAAVNADLAAINGGDMLESIARIRGLSEFGDWVVRLADGLADAGRQARMDNAERLLSEAIAWMRTHFDNRDLTMQAVCDARGISVSYLGQLFKKHLDTTFVKYLTMIRMEHAKEQLQLRGSRIMEVAEACGYRDVYYFSHCFRKYAGVPPKQYRDAHT